MVPTGNETILSPFADMECGELIGIIVNLSSPINLSNEGGDEGVCIVLLPSYYLYFLEFFIRCESPELVIVNNFFEAVTLHMPAHSIPT